MSFRARYQHHLAKKFARKLLGSLAVHGEELIATVPGRVEKSHSTKAAWHPDHNG